jgi:His/Glu/Gln/Arg/opine family amino acid ABC transporter permease subunit
MDFWRFNEVWRYREALWKGLLVTVELNFVVLLVGTVLGFVIGALRLSRSGVVRGAARVYVDLFRSFPALVFLVWLFFALPLLPGLHIRLSAFFCAALGLILNLSPFVAEICRAGILAVPVHHIHTAKVMGFSRWQVWRHITGPISFRIMLAPLFGQYINQVKLSVLASVIAVPELLHTVNTITTETFRPLELYTTLAIIFLLILIPCTCLQGIIEAKLSKTALVRGNGNGKPVAANDDGAAPEIEAIAPGIGSWGTLPRGTGLKVDGLACGYNGLQVLRDVSFLTEAATVTAIIGPNGGGKSTLVKSLSGLLDRIQGNVSLTNGIRLERARVGYVSQEHDPWPHLSVEENLTRPLVVAAGKSREEARAIAARWLAFFRLEECAKSRPNTLSGGQRQRLVLARTLCLQPQVLLLDEPTSAMDFRWALFVNRLVRRLADAGLIVLAISHGVGFVRAVANNVVFLDRGTIAEAGPASILNAPQTEGLKSFLEAA